MIAEAQVVEKPHRADAHFLDMQAAVGVTKHAGGYTATAELLTLCHVDQAHLVLNVGCGIGAGSVYVAGHYGCQVVGVDLSAEMVKWSRRRAQAAHVSALTGFHVGDLRQLPYAADTFDVVYTESVLNFIADKPAALAELVRVAKPGGYVGINEMFWTAEPPAAVRPQVQTMLATNQPLPTVAEWQALWAGTGLLAREERIHQIDAAQEVKDRIAWIGWGWLVRAWGRALRLYLTNPAMRAALKAQFDFPAEVMDLLGYGVFVGRKPGRP